MTRNSASGKYAEFMNVDVTPGLGDEYKTSGLCGSFDGNPANDGNTKPHPRVGLFQILDDASEAEHRYKLEKTTTISLSSSIVLE